jgi:hypothetical protein
MRGATPTIELGYNDATWIGGGILKLSGYTTAPPLLNDDDMTTTDFEWIIEHALANQTLGRMESATVPMGQSWRNRADQLRSKMASRQPNCVKVR